MPIRLQDVECSYYHQYIDGVDFVFVDHPCFHHHKDKIYGGDRKEVRNSQILPPASDGPLAQWRRAQFEPTAYFGAFDPLA